MRTKLFFAIFLAFSSLYANTETISSAPTTHCLACNIPDGLTVSDLTGTSATLSWNAVAGATQYTLEVQDEQVNPSVFHLETNVNGTSYAVTGLTAGVSYKFKVRARCGGDKSDWSDWVFFSAGNGGGGGSNTCDIPTGLTVVVVNGTATLAWTSVNGAVKYVIEVEDEQNTPSNFHLEDFSLTNSYTLTGLQTGVMYKFKVRTHCASGQSDWSGWMFFNGTGNGGNGGGSGTCAVPTTLSATVNGSSATLSWNKVSGAVQYYIEVEDEQNVPSTFHVEVSVQDSFYIVAGLQAGVSYKFKVRSHCASGQSDWSNWLFFNGNTGNGGIGGGSGSGNCNRPTGTQVSNITATAALLSWNAVPGVASYTLEIEREPSSPWEITQVVTTNSFLLNGLNADTKYKFKVRSNCTGGGHSNWTKWRKFKTAPSFTGTSGNSNLQNATADRSEEAPSGLTNALEVKVSPNPVQSNTTVRVQNLSVESATLRLFDLAGRMVQMQQIQSETGAWEADLNLSNLPNGLYLLQMQNGANTQTIKLVLSH